MALYGLVQINKTFDRFTRHSEGLHTVPPTFVLVMLICTHSCIFLYKFTHFGSLGSISFKLSTKKHFIIVIKTMTGATGDRIRELESIRRN